MTSGGAWCVLMTWASTRPAWRHHPKCDASWWHHKRRDPSLRQQLEYNTSLWHHQMLEAVFFNWFRHTRPLLDVHIIQSISQALVKLKCCRSHHSIWLWYNISRQNFWFCKQDTAGGATTTFWPYVDTWNVSEQNVNKLRSQGLLTLEFFAPVKTFWKQDTVFKHRVVNTCYNECTCTHTHAHAHTT